MNCQRAQRFLSLYHDGHPAGREDAAVTAHLQDCPACRQFRESLTAWGGQVRAASETEPAARREIRSAALDRWVAQQERSPAAHGQWRFSPFANLTVPPLVWGAAAAASLVAVANLGRWELKLHHSGPARAAPQDGTARQTGSPYHQLVMKPAPSAGTAAGPPAQPGGYRKQTSLKRANIGAAAPSSPIHGGSFPVAGESSPRLGPRTAPAPSHDSQPPLPDEQYLDGRDPALLARWNTLGYEEQQQLVEAIQRKLRRPADDFVSVPFPRIATSGSAGAAIAAAAREYEQEAKVTDPRLFRKVTLQDKGVALSDLCAELQAQTGVQFRASRSVADEKATVFVKEERARDVMRAISHLFGYAWVRSSRGGEYRYELDQDLRSQLADEELRQRDQNAALVAMDQQMQPYRSFLEMSYDEFQKHVDQMPLEQRKRLWYARVGGGWSGVQIYHHLLPREQAALLAGQELTFRPDDPSLTRRLPPNFSHDALMSWNPNVAGEELPVGELPGARCTQVGLRLDRTELGQVTLLAHTAVAWPGKYGDSRSASEQQLATGRNPSTVNPDNAAANAALRGHSPFDQVVSVHPEPTCPQVKAALSGRATRLPYGLYSAAIGDLQTPHVFSADVWEAVHQATGMPIVTDYYTRMYRLNVVMVDHRPLFDALCSIGDALGARWRYEGGFLLGRSTSYYWNKRKEVPNRYLHRWLKEERDGPGLSVDTLLEMASLPDEELNSIVVGEAIQHCWGIGEWSLVVANPFSPDAPFREDLRFLAELTPEHRRRALTPAGMPVTELTPAEQQRFLKDWDTRSRNVGRWGGDGGPEPPPDFEHCRFVVEYIPAGWYVWTPPTSSPEHPWARDLYRVKGRTATEALAGARQIYPEATADQVKLTKDGELYPSFSFGPSPNGLKPASQSK